VLQRSGVGATVDLSALPRSAVLAAQPEAVQRLCLLDGGDDYELLFSAPAAQHAAVRAAGAAAGVAVSCIGRIEPQPGLRLREADGRVAPARARAFDHFAAEADRP